MKYTDKDLFLIALGHFTSNADEVIDDILNGDEWAEVVLWEPFENYGVNDIHEMVLDLQSTLIKVRDSK
jgi:hypothetical protein